MTEPSNRSQELARQLREKALRNLDRSKKNEASKFLCSALPVASSWVAIAILAQLLLILVLAPNLPSSIHIFLVYGRSFQPDARIAVIDLIPIVGITLTVTAIILIVSILLKRAGRLWPDVVGFSVSILLPWFTSAVIFSALFQLGNTTPVERLSLGQTW